MIAYALIPFIHAAGCGDAPMNIYYPEGAAPEPSSAPVVASEEPTDKLGTPAAAGSSGAASRAGERATPTPVGPAPWDAAVFVGKGSAGAVPDAFLPYPRDLTKQQTLALGGVPLDDEDDTYFTVRPPTAMYERARVWFGSSEKPKRVSILRYPSDDPRAAFLELKAALEKRYGKGRAKPDGATDADADRFLWTTPRMVLGFDVPEQVMLEVVYQQ